MNWKVNCKKNEKIWELQTKQRAAEYKEMALFLRAVPLLQLTAKASQTAVNWAFLFLF